MPPVSPPMPPPVLVACLCAAWCGACRDYRALFDAQAAHAGDGARFVWVDIEDDEAALGDVDVLDFPTLLVARGDAALFFGPVMPHAQTLARVLRSAVDGELAPIPAEALDGLPQRLIDFARG